MLENGFIDMKVNGIVKEFRNNNQNFYELIYKYNNLAYKVRNLFVREASYAEVYLFVTFNQIHNSFQSFCILSERGLYSDSKIIFRSMYDKMIDFSFVMDKHDNIKYIIHDNTKKLKAMLNDIKNNQFFDMVDEKTLTSNIFECEKQLIHDSKIQIKSLSTELKAKQIGMTRQYISYRFLSEYTHNSLKTIYEQIIDVDDGIILDSGCKIENFKEDTFLAIGCLSEVIEKMCLYLNEKTLLMELKKYDKELEELLKKGD